MSSYSRKCYILGACSSKSFFHQAQIRSLHEQTESESGMTIEKLKKMTKLCLVKSWLETNSRPGFDGIRGKGYFLSLWSQWHRITLVNGIVCRQWTVLETNETRLQQVLPLFGRRYILRYCHDEKTSGHLGVDKTLASVNRDTIGLVYSRMLDSMSLDVRYVRDENAQTLKDCPNAASAIRDADG